MNKMWYYWNLYILYFIKGKKVKRFELVRQHFSRLWLAEYARFEGSQAVDTRPVSPAGL